MSLIGNVASDGYNRMDNNNAIAQARMETQVKYCSYCHGVFDLWGRGCCERPAGRLVAVVGGDGGTQCEVENGCGMGWSRCRLDEAGMLCSHSRQCGLAAKVSGRLGPTAQPDSNRHTVGSPPPQSEQPPRSGNGLARFLCFAAPTYL